MTENVFYLQLHCLCRVENALRVENCFENLMPNTFDIWKEKKKQIKTEKVSQIYLNMDCFYFEIRIAMKIAEYLTALMPEASLSLW